jgi:hypothetical protein
MDEIALFLSFVHRTASLVLALNAHDIFKDLDVEILSIQSGDERRKNICIIVLTNIDSESAFAILHGMASHLAVRVRS